MATRYIVIISLLKSPFQYATQILGLSIVYLKGTVIFFDFFNFKTQHVFRFLNSRPKLPEIRKMGHHRSPEMDTQFPEWGSQYPEGYLPSFPNRGILGYPVS